MTSKDLFPSHALEPIELLASLPYRWHWLTCEGDGGFKWTIHRDVAEWMVPKLSAYDWGAIIAAAEWLKAPVSARVSQEHYDALSQVEVRLSLREIQLPYPTVCVWMPPGMLHKAVLLHRYAEDFMVSTAYSYDARDDVTTLFKHSETESIEPNLGAYDEDVGAASEPTKLATRVAINVALCMVDRGFRMEWLRPKDVESDRRLAREQTSRGERARARLSRAVRVCRFERDEKLHAGGNGAHVSCHWRRGHWAMQPYGPGHSLRKRIYRAPVMVAAAPPQYAV